MSNERQCADTKHITSNYFFKISKKQTGHELRLSLYLEKMHNMYTCIEDIPT
jgi:hypothetical protein